MAIEITAIPPPLKVDLDGVIRVGGTRVTLDVIIHVYQAGWTPAEIVESYPSVKLSDVHYAIAYYLNNQTEVDAYLDERERLAEEVRRDVERRCPPEGIRERLLARKREQP